jgi:hypothetical protein
VGIDVAPPTDSEGGAGDESEMSERLRECNSSAAAEAGEKVRTQNHGPQTSEVKSGESPPPRLSFIRCSTLRLEDVIMRHLHTHVCSLWSTAHGIYSITS